MRDDKNSKNGKSGFLVLNLNISDVITIDDVVVIYKERKGNQITLAINGKNKEIKRYKSERPSKKWKIFMMFLIN